MNAFPRRAGEPVQEAIALADLWIMTHLREVSDSGGPNDQYIEQVLIPAARVDCENRTERTLVSTPWLLKLDAFPSAIELRQPPIIAVQSVQYLDESGTLQTLDPADYVLDEASEPGFLVPAPDKAWPATQAGAVNAVRVAYTAGYGATRTTVPPPLKFWLAAAISSMYATREIDAASPRLPHDFCDGLLQPYRLLGI